MTPDVASLLKYLSVPDFRYRDAHARPARRAHERPARAGLNIFALVSLVRGVGRTTLAANLTTTLGRRGLRAAAVDLDPRADLRAHFRERLDALTRSPMEVRPRLATAFHHGVKGDLSGGVDPAGGSIQAVQQGAGGAEIEWPERNVGFVPLVLDHASTVEAAWDCDAVVLDTAAGASDAVEQALAEADEVIIVARPNRENVNAVHATEALLARYRMRSWRRTRARYLINRFDGRRPADRVALAELRHLLGPRLVPTAIQDDTAVPEALVEGRCIEDFAPGSQVVSDLQAVARELAP